MRAAAILGLGCSPKNLKPFQTDTSVEWRLGMPAAGDDADVVLIFGGDGTIHRHLSQLVKLALPVLVVPAGSGNDFARALGLRSMKDSLAAWKKFCGGAGNARAIDLGRITTGQNTSESSVNSDGSNAGLKWGTQVAVPQTYFCCVAGVGLDSEVTRRANQWPRWLRGNGGYVLSLLPAIFRFAPLPMKIFTSTEDNHENWTVRSDQPTILAAFANAPMYGGGMKIAPRAKMDDGLLDVCVVSAVDPFKLFCMFPTVYYGRHLNLREVEYFKTMRARVETESPLDVYADGEYVCHTPVEFGVQRAALRVVILG